MVAIIKTGKSLRRIFHYNENKLKEGVASLLLTENYPLSDDQLTEHLKLKMLLKTAELNPDIKVNSVHISLNFDPSEDLSDEKMKAIAAAYLEKIGFGNQPYLVYRHHDSGHPHMHLVTTNIQQDGKRISLHNIGKLKSEPARKELESRFNLVRADEQKKSFYKLEPVSAEKVQYRNRATKNAIALVLDTVLKKYKFTSLPELNAVLNLYKVHAERGAEGSRIFKYGGLVYRVLDEKDQVVGTPIKASLFHDKPTLHYLEKQFAAHEFAKNQFRNPVKSRVDFILRTKRLNTLDDFQAALKKDGINLVIRTNKEGLVYGLTYVDFKTKCVFNGSSLGKSYSTKGILEQLGRQDSAQQALSQSVNKDTTRTNNSQQKSNTGEAITGDKSSSRTLSGDGQKSLLEQLTKHEYAAQQLPYEWRKKKKKKRKKL